MNLTHPKQENKNCASEKMRIDSPKILWLSGFMNKEQFIADIKKFSRQHGISPKEIGVRALNDSSFWSRLAGDASEQRSPRMKRVEKVYNWMSEFERKKSRSILA